MKPRVQATSYGALPDGRTVTQFELRAGDALLRVLDLGGIATALEVPDRAGRATDVLLGLRDVEAYRADTCYHGALVGRCCNRIAGGRFTLDGRQHCLAVNNGPNHLHGGLAGFNRALWSAAPFETATAAGVVLRHASPDGDEGYPGRLDIEVRYTLEELAVWRVELTARTDRPTVLNLTQHAYFNLAGHAAGGFADHLLQLHAMRYLPKDATGIPTGALKRVAGTPFDFRGGRPMAEPAGARDPQLYADGYDHSWVVDGAPGQLRPAADVCHPASGRTLSVRTTQPGIHFYNGYYNDTSPAVGKHGQRYGSKSGFAMETQHFPDSPNQPAFPSVVLRPGQTFHQVTEFAFGVQP